jgi:hypothetical protein
MDDLVAILVKTGVTGLEDVAEAHVEPDRSISVRKK